MDSQAWNQVKWFSYYTECYWLGDAPAHWRKSLQRRLVEKGRQQSVLVPTLFVLFENSLAGLVVVKVDGLLTVGNEVRYQVMGALRQELNFGKFKMVQDEASGASFNARRIRQFADYSFELDMAKFIVERLSSWPRAAKDSVKPTRPWRSRRQGATCWAALTVTCARREHNSPGGPPCHSSPRSRR